MKRVKEKEVKFTENKPLMEIIKKLSEVQKYGTYSLVGGAVIDILDGKTPKDYDFVGFTSDSDLTLMKEKGFTFLSKSSTATTFLFKGKKVQFLNRSTSDFDYTISQSSLNISSKEMSLYYDKYTYDNKILIPINLENWVNCLLRLPHWKKKGYKLDAVTYISLVHKAMAAKGKEGELGS